jgi:DNA end-binding protein Ku
VHAPDNYFAEIPDPKPPKEMPELGRHIIHKVSGGFEPDQFEDRYENALIDLIPSKQRGMPLKAQRALRLTNVIDLMEVLRRGVEGEGRSVPSRARKSPKAGRRRSKPTGWAPRPRAKAKVGVSEAG